jgi:alpha-glucosidase
MNLVGSHDTARWRHVAGERGPALVGLGMLLTFPGVPSLYAGDELGLAGHDDKTNREPMPWHDPERWDEETLAAVRGLVRLRREHAALRTGGFRWVAVAADVLVYLREDADERLLVQVSRATHPAVTLPADLLGARRADPLLEHPAVAAVDGMLTLPADGPAHHVWRLG